MSEIYDIAAHRRIRELEIENAKLQAMIEYWVKEWSKAETAEIKALLRLEDMARRQ